MGAWLGWLIAPEDSILDAQLQRSRFLATPFPDGSQFEEIIISGDVPELMIHLLSLAEKGITEVRLVTMVMENEGLEMYKTIFAPIRLFQARFPGIRVGVYAPFHLTSNTPVTALHTHLAQ